MATYYNRRCRILIFAELAGDMAKGGYEILRKNNIPLYFSVTDCIRAIRNLITFYDTDRKVEISHEKWLNVRIKSVHGIGGQKRSRRCWCAYDTQGDNIMSAGGFLDLYKYIAATSYDDLPENIIDIGKL